MHFQNARIRSDVATAAIFNALADLDCRDCAKYHGHAGGGADDNKRKRHPQPERVQVRDPLNDNGHAVTDVPMNRGEPPGGGRP